MKKNVWLVLSLSICLVNCATPKSNNVASTLTLCSIVYDEKKEYYVACTPPDLVDYELDLDDEKVSDLVCLKSSDYTRLLLQAK